MLLGSRLIALIIFQPIKTPIIKEMRSEEDMDHHMGFYTCWSQQWWLFICCLGNRLVLACIASSHEHWNHFQRDLVSHPKKRKKVSILGCIHPTRCITIPSTKKSSKISTSWMKNKQKDTHVYSIPISLRLSRLVKNGPKWRKMF